MSINIQELTVHNSILVGLYKEKYSYTQFVNTFSVTPFMEFLAILTQNSLTHPRIKEYY